MNTKSIQEQFQRCVVANYARLPLCAVRGEGSRLWDAEGKCYLDLFPGWGVAGLGHCHPAVADAIARQARKLIHVANHYYCEEQGAFAEALSTRADGQQVFFCNSGAEANEGAIKLARLARQPRFKIIAFREGFHGRTFAAVSATGTPEYQKGFAPLVPGFSHAKLNDLASVEALVDGETCAVLVEPVQGEAGVKPCTPEFLRGLRALCDRHGLVLIFDEVQTTPARLGTWFGYQHFGVVPDVLTTAKAIAGGLPMGLFMAKPEIAAFLKPGLHASTFGGNALACAAGLAGLKVIEEEGLLERVTKLGAWLEGALAKLPRVKAVRRCGFMVGIDLQGPGADLVMRCREHGLLINCTHGSTLRMLPAYNIARGELEEALSILESQLRAAAE
jgi:predicted acetylornithine/succinylornithine family transaminase